jgi:hypothetical protein
MYLLSFLLMRSFVPELANIEPSVVEEVVEKEDVLVAEEAPEVGASLIGWPVAGL